MLRVSTWAPQTRIFALAAVLVLASAPAAAQCVDSSEVTGFKVHEVRFKTLFGRIPDELQRRLNSHRGESYSAARASHFINEIVKFHDTNPIQQKYERLIANKLKLSLKAGVTELQCLRKVPAEECRRSFGDTPKCVDVVIVRHFVEVDALNPSPYLLLFPRKAALALYGAMPSPLLLLNPAFDAAHDRRFGPGARIDTATDLLELPQLLRRQEADEDAVTSSDAAGRAQKRDLHLLLRVDGRKSLNHAFYDSRVRLTLARRAALQRFQNLSIEATFDGNHLPSGAGNVLRNAGSVGVNTDVRMNLGIVDLLNFNGAYRWSHDRFTRPGQAEQNSEKSFDIRAMADGQVASGLLRAAVWTDASVLKGNRSYRRVLTRVGYGKEIAVKRRKRVHKITPSELGEECWTDFDFDHEPTTNEPTIGLEVVAGAGRTWGDVPAYAQFYAGRSPGQFLHDDFTADSLTTIPAGPTIRSLGEGGSTIGGTSFWHANLNVALPVARWSRPLIPHEWVAASPVRTDDSEFAQDVPAGDLVCRDLKSVIKTLVGASGINLMVNQQARDLLTENQKRDLRLRSIDERTPEEEARLAVAEAAFSSAKGEVRAEIEELFARDILPVTNFIADHANIIAVKPLLMFDVARLHDENGGVTRWSAGGGLQVDIVMARFEFGYLAAVSRAPGDPKGNFVARFVLKRFF